MRGDGALGFWGVKVSPYFSSWRPDRKTRLELEDAKKGGGITAPFGDETQQRAPELFLHAEPNGVDRFFPHDFEGAGIVGVFIEGERELVDGRIEGAFGQRHACEVVFLVHGYAPFADVLADRELGGAGLRWDQI